VEVGTTNRTRLADYRRALGPETGALLKVHPSNYRIEGFTESVTLGELVALGREHGLPVIHDLGSGLLRPELLEGYPPEPGPVASVEAGADAVTWSGDKLLGGPQAGIINGREDAVARMAADPLHRAVRVDTSTLGALEATLRIYRDRGDVGDRLPALRALRESRTEVRRRAEAAREHLERPDGVSVVETEAVVGGGAYPGHRIPSAGWEVTGVDGETLARACRTGDPPLVGTVREGRFRVDFRAILPGQEDDVAGALEEALRRLGGGP
jgi:L-seryl-tRNA(Ser) seleniumtransferase